MDWPPRFPRLVQAKILKTFHGGLAAVAGARMQYPSTALIEIEDALCRCAFQPHAIFMETVCALARKRVYSLDEVEHWDTAMFHQLIQEAISKRGHDWEGQRLAVTLENVVWRCPEGILKQRHRRLQSLAKWFVHAGEDQNCGTVQSAALAKKRGRPPYVGESEEEKEKARRYRALGKSWREVYRQIYPDQKNPSSAELKRFSDRMRRAPSAENAIKFMR